MTITLYEGKKLVPLPEKHVDVPENDLSKLMYYLFCVSNLISFDFPSKLIEFHNYFTLERTEINRLLYFIGALSPEILLEKKIFVKNNELCALSTNQFYSVSNPDSNQTPTEFFIGGKKVEVYSMMSCTENWLNKFYYSPKKAFSDQILNIIMNP